MTDLRTAAQQALEALEGGVDSWRLIGPAIDALKAALEQQEQAEPVAHVKVRPLQGNEWQPKVEITWVSGPFAGPLYTRPPRREWRGLTDAERASVQFESFKRGLSPLEFMELHEAALKEKNHE